MNHIPQRLSEKAFRIYEPLIKQIVERYPLPTVFDPAQFNRSGETVIARLRDAMKSYKDYYWKSTIIPEKFDDAYENSIVSWLTGGMIVIGTKDAIAKLRKPEDAQYHFSETKLVELEGEPYNLTNLKLDQVWLLAFLAHNRLLSRAIKVKLTSDDAAVLLAEFDILLEKQSDDSYILT